MRKVTLRMNENYKYEEIKKLVDSDGDKNRAALKLNCSIRTIDRLINTYKIQGKDGFVHGNRNRVPSTTIDPIIKQKVLGLYKDDFRDTNIQHFTEILQRLYSIKISDTTINHWLREEFVLSPKAKRKTKKDLRIHLLSLQKKNTSKKKEKTIKEAIHIIGLESAHPRRPRCAYFGEMIQMDASSYQWIPNQVWHLHVAIDDATNEVVGAYFDTQETLTGYYNVFHQILTGYGIPAMFYTDKRTVFEYTKKNATMDDEDTFTQFSYACHQLGTEIKTTSIAQAKGRVERLNQTLQSRLPIEFRLKNITTIESANEFLKPYLKEFNDKFSLRLNSTKTVFEKQPNNEKINQTLAIIATRKIDNGHCIKYKNKYYIPKTKKDIPVYFKNKTDCLVIESFDKQLYVNALDELYYLEEVLDREKYSKNFDKEPPVEKKKNHYIPDMNHPWKHASFLRYLETRKHRQQNGANV